LRERLAAMRTATAGISAAESAKLDVPWADLEATESVTDAVCTSAERVTTNIISGLTPFVRDDPEAAFLIAPIKRGRKAEGAPEEPKVKEPPKERARTQTGLTGKEIAGLELVIQQRAAADEAYFTWLRGNHSLPLSEWR